MMSNEEKVKAYDKVFAMLEQRSEKMTLDYYVLSDTEKAVLENIDEILDALLYV